MPIVVIDVLAEDQSQVAFAGDQHPVQALAAALAIQRSAIAFARRCSDDPHTGALYLTAPHPDGWEL